MRSITLARSAYLAASTLLGSPLRNNGSTSLSLSRVTINRRSTATHQRQQLRMSPHNDVATDPNRVGTDYPELVVFDLDACFWDQEMYEMPALPDKTVTGDLNGHGVGVTGAYSGRHKISMYKGSLIALQEHAGGKYPGMKLCFASSADTPFAEKVGRATLKLLDVLPGLTVWDLVLKDWDNQDVNQIGRQPPLSSNKARSHFPRLREVTGISYDKMLFFDDCNWGDHCGMVAAACKENGQSVVTHRTPNGLREEDWRKGMDLYKKARS